MFKGLAWAAVLLARLSFNIYAEEEEEVGDDDNRTKTPPELSVIDTDGDGQISLEEFNAYRGTTEDDEEEEEGVGVTIEEPNTLPQEIRQDLRTHGDVTARFHSVENLPGYLDDAIRMMGQKVFASLTATPIDEINVLANLGNQGPNEQRELNAVAGMVDTYGQRRGDYEMRFDRILPGYEADIRVYEYKDQIFCLVKDFAGSYIYSWPAENKKLN